MTPDVERIFVSSTCWDLVDLRAELVAHLRDLGFRPVLSDRPESDFDATPPADSIETCLSNLRASDAVMVILSQRYGPLLTEQGHGDVSATHLEYLEARRHGKPILFYVRDRLDAEHAQWVRNGRRDGLRFAWVSDLRDQRLFRFLDEHQAHAPGNWRWIFRDSRDLKEIVTRDLRRESARSTMRSLLAGGRLPVLKAKVVNREAAWEGVVTLAIELKNVGMTPAIEPTLTIPGAREPVPLETLGPGETARARVDVPNAAEGLVEVRYATVDGHVLADAYRLADSGALPHAGKRYLGDDGIRILDA